MRIMITGSIYDNVNLINRYVNKFNIDAVIISGNFGMHYLHDKKYNRDIRYNKKTNFYEYLSGVLEFNVPVYTLYGKFDSKKVCKALLKEKNKDLIKNFNLIDGFDIYKINDISFTGVGGYYLKHKFESNSTNKKYMSRKEFESVVENDAKFIVMHDVVGRITKHKRVYTEYMKTLIDSGVEKIFVGGHDFYHNDGKVIFLPPITKGFALYDNDYFYINKLGE